MSVQQLFNEGKSHGAGEAVEGEDYEEVDCIPVLQDPAG
jgi:hypothetical protein